MSPGVLEPTPGLVVLPEEPTPDWPEPGAPDRGNFIAFIGTRESSRPVQDALSAFRNVSGFPARGVAAPAYVQGVTLSGHGSYRRAGDPAVVITDTGFVRYPYYRMNDRAADPPDTIDYQDTARVVRGLADTIRALSCAAHG